MASAIDAILDEVRALLEEGKSLSITTIDRPTGNEGVGGLADGLSTNSIFGVGTASGRRCVQWVILPTGEIRCAKYAD
jgi:hypothetical protein